MVVLSSLGFVSEKVLRIRLKLQLHFFIVRMLVNVFVGCKMIVWSLTSRVFTYFASHAWDTATLGTFRMLAAIATHLFAGWTHLPARRFTTRKKFKTQNIDLVTLFEWSATFTHTDHENKPSLRFRSTYLCPQIPTLPHFIWQGSWTRPCQHLPHVLAHWSLHFRIWLHGASQNAKRSSKFQLSPREHGTFTKLWPHRPAIPSSLTSSSQSVIPHVSRHLFVHLWPHGNRRSQFSIQCSRSACVWHLTVTVCPHSSICFFVCNRGKVMYTKFWSGTENTMIPGTTYDILARRTIFPAQLFTHFRAIVTNFSTFFVTFYILDVGWARKSRPMTAL